MEDRNKKAPASTDKPDTDQDQGSDWLKSAIASTQQEDLESQATINKMDFETTLSRSEYQAPLPPTDRILKRAERKTEDLRPKKNDSFLYSLIGLLLGSALGLTGSLLIIHGYFSPHTWLGQLLDVSPQYLNDVLPGVVMFALGIFLIFITKQKTPAA